MLKVSDPPIGPTTTRQTCRNRTVGHGWDAGSSFDAGCGCPLPSAAASSTAKTAASQPRCSLWCSAPAGAHAFELAPSISGKRRREQLECDKELQARCCTAADHAMWSSDEETHQKGPCRVAGESALLQVPIQRSRAPPPRQMWHLGERTDCITAPEQIPACGGGNSGNGSGFSARFALRLQLARRRSAIEGDLRTQRQT
jgi:hypothetical protein